MTENGWNFDYPKIAKDSGFRFKQTNDDIIDWRRIGGIDVDKIIHNKNIEKLDNIIDHLAEVPLGPILSSNILESGIAKYFMLSQLAIQYLIFCKRFLDETVITMQKTLKELQSENLKYKKSNFENTNDVLQLHKELQKLRNINEVVFPCSMCTKNFVSNEMLNIHISKKHSNEIQSSNNVEAEKRKEKNYDKNLISTIKLELEIKHLKERLNDAEKVIKNQTQAISKEIEEIKKSPRNIQIPPPNENRLIAKTVAVQNDIISTHDVGIQSNLVDEKEKDDIDTMEKNNILNIFNQINEKINHIEKVRDDELKKREESLMKFETKLKDVADSLEAKQQINFEFFNKFTDKMSSQNSLNQDLNLDEIKEYIGNTMSKIQSENEKQIRQIVEKFDETYLDKLNTLKTKVENINDVNETSRENPIDLKSIMNENTAIIKILKERDQVKHKPILQDNPIIESKKPVIIQNPTMKSKTQDKNIIKKKYQSETSLSSESFSDSDTSNIDNSHNLSKYKSSLSKTKSKSADLLNTSIKSSKTFLKQNSKIKEPKQKILSEKLIIPPLKLSQSSNDIESIVKKMQDDRLKEIEVDPNTSSIPSSSMPEILNNLSKIRKKKSKKFPNFNTTRNQIKNLVDKIIRSKNIPLIKKNTDTAKIESENVIAPPFKVDRSKEDVDQSESEGEVTSSSTSSSNDIEPKNSAEVEVKSVRDEFKNKLERILSSPIHKLQKQAPNRFVIKTPVPTPRRKVMFDFPTKNSSLIRTDIESSSNLKLQKTYFHDSSDSDA